MNIKRTIAAILAFLALASFAGCKGEKKGNSTSTSAEAFGAEVSETEGGADTEPASGAENNAVKTISAKDVKDKSKYFLNYINHLYDEPAINYGHWFIVERKSDDKTHVDCMKTTYDSHGNFKSYFGYASDGKTKCKAENKYVYNADGTIKSYTAYTDGKAECSRAYEYDAKKRITKITYRVLGEIIDDTPRVSYETISYDDSASTKTVKSYEDMYNTGKFVFVSETVEKYDSKGNLIEERIKTTDEANTAVHSYKYDENGRCIYEKYADGSEDKTTYDSHGNVLISETKSSSGETIVEKNEYKYDQNGGLLKSCSSSADGNSDETYTYETIAVNDEFGNPTNIKIYRRKGSGKNTLLREIELSYVYEKDRITISVAEIDHEHSLNLKYTNICEYHQQLPAIERMN